MHSIPCLQAAGAFFKCSKSRHIPTIIHVVIVEDILLFVGISSSSRSRFDDKKMASLCLWLHVYMTACNQGGFRLPWEKNKS